MIRIPEDYFQNEIRLDFEITETMKRAWAIQLTLLNQVMEIANRHHFKLWLDYGSLLGAVRHNGYVPWDDDIDICMERPEYMRFLFILEKELPEYCRVRSFYTTPNYDQPKAFISNRDKIDASGTTVSSKADDFENKKDGQLTASEISDIYYGLPYVAGVDLYPLDYAPADEDQWNLIREIYMAVYDLAQKFDTYKENGELEGYVIQIEELLNVSIERGDNLKTNLWKLADSVAQMTHKSESNSMLWYPDAAMRRSDMRRPLSAYSETIITDFEMLKVPIPAGYHEILLADYGKNYMTPKRQSSTHEYPFYKVQQEWLDRHS
jgi:lipopolysaccharide cholinephosphotransferase